MSTFRNLLSEAGIEYAEERVYSYRKTAVFMECVKLTPDGFEFSEAHGQGVFLTRAEASRASAVDNASMVAMLVMLAPIILGAVALGNLAFVASDLAWLGWIAGLASLGTMAFSYMALNSKVTNFFIGESHKVTYAMTAGWTRARKTIEHANMNNTVPDILEVMGELESELKLIIHEFNSVIDPVQREQMEADFLFACGLIEALESAAVERRNELYAGNRKRYLELVTKD